MTSRAEKLVEAGLRYAGAGYRAVLLHGVDPKTKACTCPKGAACKSAGKHPRLPNWTKAATLDPATIRRWYAKHPDSNIGLMPPDGCVVVDVDPRNGGDKSLELLDFPRETPTQRSGGGGAHYVLRVDDVDALPKYPGIDYIKPGKNQFVAEPSVHVSGQRYEWIEPLDPTTVDPARWHPLPLASNADGGLAPMPLYSPNALRTHIQTQDVDRHWSGAQAHIRRRSAAAVSGVEPARPRRIAARGCRRNCRALGELR